MKKHPVTSLLIVSSALFLFIGGRSLLAQNANHAVTVRVLPMAYLDINQTFLSLTAGSGAVAGIDSVRVTDQTTILSWADNHLQAKITVSTDLAAPRYILRVQAVNPTAPGVAQPEHVLVSAPQAYELITGIGRMMGTSFIRYTGVAYASQGTGPADVHQITYTLQTQ